MNKDLLIIIPAYNEEDSIGKFLNTFEGAGIFEIADVLVINDGSKDDTSNIAKSYGANVVTHIYNLGYGCALQTGYKYAVREDYKYVIQIDADGQHDVSNIKNIYGELKDTDDKVEIIIGSRFLNGSISFKVNFIKKIAMKFFRFVIKSSTKQVILDPTSGLQGLSKSAFLFYSYYNNFVYDFPDANMIIQMLLNNFKIKEIPSVMHSREGGKSMHSGLKPIIYIFKMVINTFVVIAREKIAKK